MQSIFPNSGQGLHDADSSNQAVSEHVIIQGDVWIHSLLVRSPSASIYSIPNSTVFTPRNSQRTSDPQFPQDQE